VSLSPFRTGRTPVNQVCFLLQLGYFRATHRFFSHPYPPYDVAYVARRLGVLPHTMDVLSYDEATARRHRRLILEHVDYRPFDAHAKRRVIKHLRPLIRSQVRPKVLFQEAVAFLPDRKIEIPGSGTLIQLILEAVAQHKHHHLIEQVRTALPLKSRRALDALFEKAPAASEEDRTKGRSFWFRLRAIFRKTMRQSRPGEWPPRPGP
jgi:hypothetical protein